MEVKRNENIKKNRNNAVFKLEKGEGFEDSQKYMVILNYDKEKEYCGLDGDIYEETFKEAVESVCNWQ